jgi:gas vesicle protein
MKEQRGFSGSQIALAFLGGVAAGAAVAMLTAPRSGRETREQIGGYIRRGKQKTTQLPEAVRSATRAAKEAFDGELAEPDVIEVGSSTVQ